MNIKRKELILQLVENYGYTKKAAASVVDDFTGVILYNLGNGNTVSLRDFGCFDMLVRKARKCPNPQTGEMIDVPEHYTPRFYPGNGMKVAVKVWEDSTKRGII